MYKHPIEIINFAKDKNISYIVEASAGTGKTWTIERLYIKALLETENIFVENILVLTFTKSSTYELKWRILKQLEEAIKRLIAIKNNINDDNKNDLSKYLSELDVNKIDIYIFKLHLARQNFDLAAIYTIHGFCTKILNDFQLECHSNLPFIVKKEYKDIYEHLIISFLRLNIFTNSKLVLSIDKVLENINILIRDTSYYNNNFITKLLNLIPQNLFVIENKKICLNKKFIINSSLEELLLSDSSELKDKLQYYKDEFTNILLDFISKNINFYLGDFSVLSYNALVELVADSLKSNEDFALKLYKEYPIAFIDEFQDTDYLQCTIFNRIYKLDNSNFARGKVILVGDPKQAIYGFRGADIQTYLKMRGNTHKQLNLDYNFRSTRNLVDFVNCLFCKNDNVLGNGISYKEVLSYEDQLNYDTVSDYRFKQHLFYNAEIQIINIVSEDSKYFLLNAICFEIAKLLYVDRVPSNLIAILVYSNEESALVSHYLSKFNISVTTAETTNVFKTSVAKDLAIVIDSILDIHNNKKFNLAILTQLIRYKVDNIFDFDVYKVEIEFLKKQFYQYRNIFENYGIMNLCYAILTDNIHNQHLGCTPINYQSIILLTQLCELLEKKSKSFSTTYELFDYFLMKISNPYYSMDDVSDENNEEIVRLVGEDRQITVLTQHKAKGLEFDFVFLPYFRSKKNNDDLDEIHRLNYVALTRARKRMYIYLKKLKYTKTNTLNKNQQIPVLYDLFGINTKDHQLFNYDNFFSEDKNPFKQDITGAINYIRDINIEILSDFLKEVQTNNYENKRNIENITINNPTCFMQRFYLQSYSSISTEESEEDDDIVTYLFDDKGNHQEDLDIIIYEYSILNDREFKGASFGVLFHELCEKYPLNEDILNAVTSKYNLPLVYKQELAQIINKVFSYKIYRNLSLNKLTNYIHELEFTLKIKNHISFTGDIYKLFCKFFPQNHPFIDASLKLKSIKSGYIHGYIDLFFEFDGKYWILDYKTNNLYNYQSINIASKTYSNIILTTMADHHYYLQYLLYLVAIKRYLEFKLKVVDSSSMIGGAIYYFVRGLFTNNSVNQGIFLDTKCQELIRELDMLFLQ